MATIHFLLGPAGSGKTTQLLDQCSGILQQESDASLWLAPTRRTASAIRPKLSNPAIVYSIEEFAEELIVTNDSQARPLTQAGRRVLIDMVIEQLRKDGTLGNFARVSETRGFIEGIFGLIEELKQHEIWPSRFSASVRKISDADAVMIGLREKATLCATIYEQYQRFLVQKSHFDHEGKLWYARELFRQNRREPFDKIKHIFIDGFVRFTRSQQELFGLFAEQVEHLWITLPMEQDSQRNELFSVSGLTQASLHRRFTSIDCTMETEFLERRSQSLSGLQHLERSLFLPIRGIEPTNKTKGIARLEAPGMTGEVRMVARQIKELLLNDVRADDILVTMREVEPYAELIADVFHDYGIPIDIEGFSPLSRTPQIATLLKALRLPDEHWPFAEVTALLRSGWFRPDWPETRLDPQKPEKAEALLRLLGEPRDKDAYLQAVKRWAINPPEGLEDEAAEESRRRRTHDLAKECGPFLERFFDAWNDIPLSTTLTKHIDWLWSFADNLGLVDDDRAKERLRTELNYWIELDRLSTGSAAIDRKTFLRRLSALLSETGLARTRRGPGRVRVLSAPLARNLDVEYLFVLGLGERSFPLLSPPSTFFDEHERQQLSEHGIRLAGLNEMMAEEMLLFYQLVTRPCQRLTLSFPAVDERGQDLLPGSFLRAVHDCFADDAIVTERRNMLIEGYDQDEPYSLAEHRAQVGLRLANAKPDAKVSVKDSTWANLLDASELAQQRFHSDEYTPYDGMLQTQSIIKQVASLFGPERIFSPTALEEYVACPFRFFLGHVLRLEPLAEPREEIEVTRRGQAVHRALARLHANLQQRKIHQPIEEIDALVQQEFDSAINEDAERAPGPASKALWALEGQRLIKVASRYRGQWESFVKPWQKVGIAPEPFLFEVDFGLPAEPGSQNDNPPLIIRNEAIEVRISGRVDRIDATTKEGDTVFWIIDYKTGRGSHYTGSALLDFQRLQLTLYALAVEQVLLADKNARPLGLAYWLVGEKGAKVVLPKRGGALWLSETSEWQRIREQLQQWILTLAQNIRLGVYPLKPRSEDCTSTCDYGQICRITQARSLEKAWALPLPTLDN